MPYRGRVDDPFGFGAHRPTLTRRDQGTAQIAAFETEREFRFSRTFDDPRPRTSSTVLIFETVASLPGPILKIARQEQGESTWDPLNACEVGPQLGEQLDPKPNCVGQVPTAR